MRVLVTGAGGQLGHDVVRAAAAAGDDVARPDPRRRSTSPTATPCSARSTSLAPDVVVNCAAWTAVDACEADPERAMAANGLAVRWVAEACDRVGAHLVHVSTDYVFDGRLRPPVPRVGPTRTRSASTARRSWPASARRWCSAPAAAVVRTSWVCGEHGPTWSRRSCACSPTATTARPLAFVDDQIGHPTFTADLAPMLRRLAVERRAGVHHVTNQGAVSWYGFAQEVVAAAGRTRPWCARSPRPSSTRRAPRRARPTASSTTPSLRVAGIPLLRDFREPLAELVAVLTSH